MAEVLVASREAGGDKISLRRHWARKLLNELLALLLVLLILLAGALVLLDTAPGHRFIVDRIGQVETATGLRIRVARIEGSICPACCRSAASPEDWVETEPRPEPTTRPDCEPTTAERACDWAVPSCGRGTPGCGGRRL